MNGPPRLTERGGEVARILHSANRDAPPKDGRGRALAATATLVAAATAPRGTAAAAASSGASALVKWIAIVTVGGGAAIYGVSEAVPSKGKQAASLDAARTEDRPITSAPAATAPLTAETSAATGERPIPLAELPAVSSSKAFGRPNEPRPRRAPTTDAPSSSVSANGPPSDADLADEIAALDAAKRALGRGDADGTLAFLDRYSREFPRGALEQEALVLRIRALAHRGDRDGAVTLYRQLARSSPTSPHCEPLRRVLGLQP